MGAHLWIHVYFVHGEQGITVRVEFGDSTTCADPSSTNVIGRAFPHTFGQPLAHFLRATAKVPDAQIITEHPPMRFVNMSCPLIYAESIIFLLECISGTVCSVGTKCHCKHKIQDDPLFLWLINYFMMYWLKWLSAGSVSYFVEGSHQEDTMLYGDFIRLSRFATLTVSCLVLLVSM